jgi:hypothetical protein
MRQLLLLFVLIVSRPLAAQVTAVQIDPGMTRAQVIERLGNPATERTSAGFTYLFYINGCERTCGMNDLVTLRGDSVVDAIFRAPHRSYSGRSTSPAQNRTPKADRGPLTISPARSGDSVVMRIVPADPAGQPPPPPPPAQARDLPLGDLTGRTIVPGARPDSLRGSRLPVDVRSRPDTARPGADPGRQPQVSRSDTVMNPKTPADSVPLRQPQVSRSDTVMNPRTPVSGTRPDSVRPVPPAPAPRTPPPSQPPPAT